MAEGAAATSKNLEKQAICEECKANRWKYKCPGCSLLTCSLPCVKAHKLRTACTGKRDQTQFVPLSQFDDNILLSDFNLLEDVKRVAESARRTRVKLCGYPKFKLPVHLKGLQGAAARRRTKLWFLPSGMLRRERNRSRYNQRKKSISWTIEWRFHSADLVLLDHGIHESMTLRSAIEKHLQPSPWNHKLRKFCVEKLENLKFFICKYPKGPRSAFRELDINAPVSHLLSDLVILEYPVIHIFLPSYSFDFEVVRDLRPNPVKQELKLSERDNHPSHPDGVHFKEEEIEEDEEGSNLDPQIIGLTKNTKSSSHDQNTTQQSAENVNMHMNRTEVLQAAEDLFEFDQDLIDTCSFLMEQSNPDEFLDFDMDFGAAQDCVAMDELEEGEIPGFE